MEVKRCSVQGSFFCLWAENSTIFLEESASSHLIPLSSSMYQWLMDSFSEITSNPVYSFFFRKTRLDLGLARLSKYRSASRWSLDLSVWPSSGGRHSIQVPAGSNAHGWDTFSNFLKDFNSVLKVHLSSPCLQDLPCPSSSKADNQKSYAEAVHSRIPMVLNASPPPKDSLVLSPSHQFPSLPVWVRKDKEVCNPSLDSLLVVSRFLAGYSWMKVKKVLEGYFQSKVIINPFMADKALVKLGSDFVNLSFEGKWDSFDSLHLKIEKWSDEVHMIPEVVLCHGGWLSIQNLPLPLWKRGVFEAIGAHFGGLVSISSQTLNLLDLSQAFIQVKENVCGFTPATIPISFGSTKLSLSYQALSPLKLHDRSASRQVFEKLSRSPNSLDTQRLGLLSNSHFPIRQGSSVSNSLSAPLKVGLGNPTVNLLPHARTIVEQVFPTERRYGKNPAIIEQPRICPSANRSPIAGTYTATHHSNFQASAQQGSPKASGSILSPSSPMINIPAKSFSSPSRVIHHKDDIFTPFPVCYSRRKTGHEKTALRKISHKPYAGSPSRPSDLSESLATDLPKINLSLSFLPHPPLTLCSEPSLSNFINPKFVGSNDASDSDKDSLISISSDEPDEDIFNEEEVVLKPEPLIDESLASLFSEDPTPILISSQPDHLPPPDQIPPHISSFLVASGISLKLISSPG